MRTKPGAGHIVWLASYPKSGNTWLRALLTNYLSDSDEPADINSLIGGPIASDRGLFDRIVGAEASSLSADEIEKYRPEVYRHFSARSSERRYLKVHDAFTLNSRGDPIISEDATYKALYVVRHPCDVAVSLAYYRDRSIEKTLECMSDPGFGLALSRGRLHKQLGQRLLTWSQHVESWLDRPRFPVLPIKYEDLLAEPKNTFEEILRFLELEVCWTRLNKAVAFSDFRILKKQEKDSGFEGRSLPGKVFFRIGKFGLWKETLSSELAEAVWENHEFVMKRLGYFI